jgi:hypothetical protein
VANRVKNLIESISSARQERAWLPSLLVRRSVPGGPETFSYAYALEARTSRPVVLGALTGAVKNLIREPLPTHCLLRWRTLCRCLFTIAS